MILPKPASVPFMDTKVCGKAAGGRFSV